MASNGEAKPGNCGTTRVFKKSSPNNKITTYLGKRDFIDSGTSVDPVDGVVLVDADYLKDRKVYANILAAFRYGREDLDVLGLTFRKDLFVSTVQVYPPLPNTRPLTQLQNRLLKKLGPNAHPFFFELPQNAPSSVTLQPAPDDTGKPCGVDYELKTYVADNEGEKSHKRNSVRLAIRKLTYAPDERAPQPRAEDTREFMLSSGKLKLETSLDKEKYYHGERIAVNVMIDNSSSKTVKKIKISVYQMCDVYMFNNKHSCSTCMLHVEEGMPVQPSQSGFCKVYMMCPSLDDNRDKRGLGLDGKLKHEDTNLASSTIIRDNVQRENLGIVVQYKVKVKLLVGLLSTSDITVEMPFTLTHPKPVTPPPSRPISAAAEDLSGVDMNLIQLEEGNEPAGNEDDIIFEDFARLRLKGHDLEEAEA